jgi:hypothetical protein
VDGPHDVRPGQAQNVVVAPKVARMVAEALTAEVGLGQAVALDQGPSGSVEYEDPLLEEGPEQGQALIARPGVACRRFLEWRRRRDRGDFVGRAGGDVSLGEPASFWAQCTGRTKRIALRT